jgi:hypothetical protein
VQIKYKKINCSFKTKPVTGDMNKKMDDMANYNWWVLNEYVKVCDPSITQAPILFPHPS